MNVGECKEGGDTVFGFSWLDAVLILWLLWQLIYGLSTGLVVSLGGLAGFVAGAVAAFFAAPFVSGHAPGPGWRTAFVIGATILLIAVGHAVGIRIGRAMGNRVKSGPVRTVNRLLGGALNLLVGFVAGAVAAFFAAPFVSGHAPGTGWRTAFVIGATIIFIAAGHAVGIRIGRAIGNRVTSGPVRTVNRLLGGALNLLVGAAVISLLAFGVANLGIPAVSKQLSGSVVISKIDAWTPDSLKSAAAQMRSLVLDEGIPQLLNPAGPNVQVAAPNANTDTPTWNNAAKSVLKISGTAFQCGQNQTGTGFVVAPNRVMTNAHVVAGVTMPVVATQAQASLPARVVYFDPVKDLAVLAVDGLNVAPLPTAATLHDNAQAAFAGYPLGGPLQVRPATVLTSGPMLIPDITGTQKSLLDIYQLAGNVQSGNSGGPLLDHSGRVVGVVFAKSTASEPVGFAFTMNEVAPVIAAAPMLNSAVASGRCSVK